MNSLDFFLQITQIPRQPKKEDKIAQYLVDFAKSKNYEFYKDKLHNVIIKANNNSEKTIILQAHTDMVCEAVDKHFDFDNTPITPIINGDTITATNTTLGADDGFGVALILNILANMKKGYPNIEAVFTTQEEIGMYGAQALDCSTLKSNMLINLDSTNSNEIIVSCASGSFIQFEKEITYTKLNKDQNVYTFSISNLLSGHSGEDINKGRANAIKECIHFISLLNDVKLIDIKGCTKDNLIPNNAEITFTSNNDINPLLEQFVSNFKNKYKNEIKASFKTLKAQKDKYITNFESIIAFINEFENGVLKTNEKNTPIASINLASINICNNKVILRAMLRNNVQNDIEYYYNIYKNLASKHGFSFNIEHFAPLFENNENCKLKEICEKSYIKLFHNKPNILDIHAGLEGGVFASKIKDLQVVSLGADLQSIHTINESLKISSLTKLEKWLDDILLSI